MYLVKYKAASCNELNGFVRYYADPEDAFNTGLFCEKIIVWVDVDLFPTRRYDKNNNSFRRATEWEIREFV